MKPKKPIVRPYATVYYVNASDIRGGVTVQGFAASDRGAIRASVVRIFMGEYAKAVIYDRRREIPLYTVKLGKTGLQIHYGSDVVRHDNSSQPHTSHRTKEPV